MQSIGQYKQITGQVLGRVVSAAGLFLALSVAAQTPPVPLGGVLYEKLARTQLKYQQALATGDSMQVAETCYLMGKRYSGLGDYVTAQKWFIRSLRIREPHGFSEDIGKVYLRMAENQVTQKQYEQAMRYARRAMANFQTVQSRHGLMSASNVLAGVHELGWWLNQEKPGSIPTASPDSSFFYFRRAERMAIALKKPADIANIYICMGASLARRNGHRALPYLKKAYEINRQSEQVYAIINSSYQLANCYLSIGQPLVAKQWLDTATYVRDTARHGDYWQNGLIEETYTKLYEQTGQWQKAFEHQRNYYSLRIDALNADREGIIAQTGIRYENEKKEAQLAAQRKELALRQQNLKAQQRLTFMIAGLLALAGMACLFFYWLFRKYRRLSGHNAKLVKEQNHRVKNNLQSIASLLGLQFNRLTDSAARQAVEESLLRVEAMALVHQRLYDGDRLVEVDLSQYIPELVGGVLRSFSFGHIRPAYVLDTVWVSADAAINLGLLLNELITNSCKYAFPLHPDPMLEITCQEENGRLELRFTDNGPGLTRSVKSNSFGLKLIDMITEKLKGQKSFNLDNGCRFALSFALQPLLSVN